MNLSYHFTLEEFIVSQEAVRRGIDNTPLKEEIENLKRVAAAMERVRIMLGSVPIVVTSGFRCLELNRAIGSRDSSAHVKGLAVDFICPGHGTPYDICVALARYKSDLKYDQLIHEFGRWVHLGFSDGEPRMQNLTIDSNGTREGIQHV